MQEPPNLLKPELCRTDVPTVNLKESPDTRIEQTQWLIQRILTLLSGMANAGNSQKAAEFRRELAACSQPIVDPVPGESIDGAARKCLALCQDFFQNSDSYRVNHDETYSDIIDLLRNALRTLTGDTSLDQMVVTSTARFREMAKVQDLGLLKKQIAEEVESLERSARDHQKNRERTMRELNDRTQALEHRLTRTRERLSLTVAESSLDPLTRVANRGHFDIQLASWMEPRAKEVPFVVAMFDLDDFKKVNDIYGHQVGDRVLRGVARCLRQVTRDEDILARYGGEEFILLLRNVTAEKAHERCTEILKSVAAKSFEWDHPTRVIRLSVTISCGMTEFSRGDTIYDILHRADTALYQAKKLGKNRIEIQQRQETVGSGSSYQRI